jgi:ATP-dependent Clp protease adaptor protein ClpS
MGALGVEIRGPLVLPEKPLVCPRVEEEEEARLRRPWIVILYNDEWHPYDQVVFQVQKATGCSLEEAEWITWEAHTHGRAIAYTGAAEECERVANILREIRLQVETDAA